MEVSVSDAKAQLTDLVRRAEAGEEIVLTRHGQAAVKLTPVRPAQTAQQRRAILTRVLASARNNIKPGPSSKELQDELYDEHGLPK